MAELQELLGCSVDEGLVVLRHFKWNIDRFQNEWFGNEESIRKKIGLTFDPKLDKE